ncbi:hypothetical protein B0H12DRAFT_1028556 [Mycena haematopus]|nr:hypothetical protein B0H12DRAFT_1028556 [Mycena haematopus]
MFRYQSDGYSFQSAVLDFRSLVSAQDFQRLKDFIYIDSAEAFEEFSQFVQNLGVKKIQDWWDHKEMSSWILPCLIKSQSPMRPEDWDNTPATTNTGEGQHYWTKLQTGGKLSLVEAIERHIFCSHFPRGTLTQPSLSGRELDERVAREIQISMESGVLINPRNESSHRRSRTATRQTTAVRKSQESREHADELAQLALEIEIEKQAKKESAARLKDL